jgi:hypothetical protein
MTKKHLNLLIEADLLQKARDNGLVIGKFLEIKLQEYFTFIQAISKTNNPGFDAGNGIRTRVSSLGS